ncbi:uncharacterized protein (TIGR00369 family) [Bradyrhizobium sp. USDA 3311]
MNDADNNNSMTLLKRAELKAATGGEFEGWRTSISDVFLDHAGPFWHRLQADGTVRCAFRVQKKHLNGAGNVHGGCFLSFADYCLFAISDALSNGVTVFLSSEFLNAAREGELIEATGEITRSGGSLTFVRGQMKAGERLLFTFSGVIKRPKPKSRPEAEATSI